MGHHPSFSDDKDKIILEHFPDIPGLTLQQREKIGSLLTKEREDIENQMNKKRDLEIDLKKKENPTDKEIKKNREKADKIDKKILDIREKTNKKAEKVLSKDQYLVFIDKRQDFKFKQQRSGRPDFRKEEGRDHNMPPGERNEWEKHEESNN